MSCLTRRGYRIDRTEENMKYLETLTLHPEEQSKNSYNDFKEPEEKGEVPLEILKNVVDKWDDYISTDTDSKKKISVVFEKCE